MADRRLNALSLKGAASRREFLRQGATAAAATALAANVFSPRMAHAAGDDTLRVGLIGCGGRGLGAAADALGADKNLKIFALADAFPDRVVAAREQLRRSGGERVDLADERCFHGFDAYKQLIDIKEIDVVLLTTPPHFRPMHYQYAIEKGKHTFVEKPVAVDAPGYRSVLTTNEMAKQKGLAVVSGLCWRYDLGVRETMKRVLDGAIGDIVTIQENYNAGFLWHRGRKPGWSEMEYQMRNWLYFTWLSGDHNVEQHVHSLDKASWLMGDKPPLRATGLGGRQVRTDEKWGNIFDHHAVVYEYPNGVKLFAFCRQQDGTSTDTEDYFMGTRGRCEVLKHAITGGMNWSYSGPKPNMYSVEHQELYASIRAGKPIYNGDYMATSSMLAIMGRMATYTGQEVTWDQAFNSKQNLAPESYAWGPAPEIEIALPGVTKLI
ncbi:MAG: Gfo/Idh/MocA family oxidoreductase [Pirellulales bacterium]